MRLIDADALKRAFCRNCYETCAGHCDDLQIIDDRPTIEAEPVRRGRWVEGINDKWVCSECGTGNNYAYSWDITGYQLQDRYCPNCGVKMDVEKI